MKLTIGQKVKFLNEVGGGIVSKIISPTMVNVTTEDGFDMPYLACDLIPAFSSDTVGKMFNANEESYSSIDSPDETDDHEEYERESSLDRFSSAKRDPAGIYLCFVPHDQVWLLKDDLDVYIVNNTDHLILYNFLLNPNENEWEGVDYGSVNPNSKMLIDSIQREDLNRWTKGMMQIMVHFDKSSQPIAPINHQYAIKSSKFFNKESYHSTSFLAQRAVTLNIGIFNEPVVINLEEHKKYDALTVAETSSRKIMSPATILENFITEPGVAEVDLHIEALVDDPSEVDSVQMLTIQTSTFNKYLEEAMRIKLQKIIFIHGVGIGRLKSEIIKILKQYPSLHYFDAPMSKYGSGATEVWIKE
jgi:hypothetical protein